MDSKNQCLAYKNKHDSIQQCPNKIKFGAFCGIHRNCKEIAFNKDNIQQHTSKSRMKEIISQINNITDTNVGNYLSLRKNYIKDTAKYIELSEFIMDNKLENYSSSRIVASIEYYKLLGKTTNNINNTNNKFLIGLQYNDKLISFFNILLKNILNIDKVIKIQRWYRRMSNIMNIKLRGPALFNRSLCVNDCEFVSLDKLIDITDDNFFSFQCEKGFIYGFHIDSIIELIIKSDEQYNENINEMIDNMIYKKTFLYHQFINTIFNHYNKIKIYNPYTRFIIPGHIKYKIIKLFAIQKYKNLIADNTNRTQIRNTNTDIITYTRNKCFSIFQKIEMFGYFINTEWLLNENIRTIKQFYSKLANIWNFEFGLSTTAKYNISKNVSLFNNDNVREILHSRLEKHAIINKILNVLNILVTSGETDSDKNTGCILILYAMASINPQCVANNPWLAN